MSTLQANQGHVFSKPDVETIFDSLPAAPSGVVAQCLGR